MTLIGDTMMWEQTGPKPVRGNAAGQRVEQPSHPFRAGLPARRSQDVLEGGPHSEAGFSG